MSVLESFQVVKTIKNETLNAFVQTFAWLVLAVIAGAANVGYAYLVIALSHTSLITHHIGEGVFTAFGLFIYIFTLVALAVRQMGKPY